MPGTAILLSGTKKEINRQLKDVRKRHTILETFTTQPCENGLFKKTLMVRKDEIDIFDNI